MSERLFYYSEGWASDRLKLPGLEGKRQVRWWTEDSDTHSDEVQDHLEPNVEVDPVAGVTVRDRLDGLVETFVIGWPRVRLIRKQGFGMDPPFKRMSPPRTVVVEMRTHDTRTFGFFAGPRKFVALSVDLADNTHTDRTLYETYGDKVLKLLERVDHSDINTSLDIDVLIGD
jgi:hypothetical protein